MLGSKDTGVTVIDKAGYAADLLAYTVIGEIRKPIQIIGTDRDECHSLGSMASMEAHVGLRGYRGVCRRAREAPRPKNSRSSQQ